MSIQEKLVLPSGAAQNTQSLFDYWCRIRGEDLVPRRSDLRPADLLPLLPSLMILEYRGPGTLIYRLAGTACAEKLGIDFTGLNLFDHIAPRQRRKAEDRINTIRTYPCGLIVHEKLRSKHQTLFVAEVIYLPLCNRDGEITQLLGSVITIERGERGAMADNTEAMTAIAAQFLDIGAGVPQSLSNEASWAV